MPNGKLGDNPVTDIVVHKQEVFGRRIDDLIRRLHAYGYWDNWAGNSYLFDLQERWRRVQLERDSLEFNLEQELKRVSGE